MNTYRIEYEWLDNERALRAGYTEVEAAFISEQLVQQELTLVRLEGRNVIRPTGLWLILKVSPEYRLN